MKREKKIGKVVVALGALAISLSGVSCSSDKNSEPDTSGNTAAMKATITQYVNNVVVSTYSSLADEALQLQAACEELEGNATQDNVRAACAEWISARKYWERSEAFLYGAAKDYNIDPHIDSWPLDKSQLDNLLANETIMDQFDADYAGTYLGYGLLGFHAVEYVLFRDGGPRNVTEISANELKYAAVVAEDLARQCIRLEASWAGIDNVTAAKRQILEDSELEPGMNYGESLMEAGEAGNVLYKTQVAAYVQILRGCSDIADEVGNTKISDPVASGNVLDVESWYSWNSITDYADNIRSIQNAYLGGIEGNRNATSSVSAYVKAKDATLDADIQAAITTAITEIEAMPAPFRNHLTNAETDNAVAACQNLMNKLDKAIEKIQE